MNIDSVLTKDILYLTFYENMVYISIIVLTTISICTVFKPHLQKQQEILIPCCIVNISKKSNQLLYRP